MAREKRVPPWQKIKPSDRVWVKHKWQGSIGFLYEDDDGSRRVRLDRPHDPNAHKPYDPGVWERHVVEKHMLPMQVAQVAHAADRALCLFVGRHELVGKDWGMLTEQERIEWMDEGPDPEDDPVRAKLFAFVKDALKGEL